MNEVANKFRQSYVGLDEKSKEMFKELVNKLISVNYLTAEKVEDKTNYYFILANIDCFQSYFALAGMELVHYTTTKVFVLKSEYFVKQSLSRIGSIILLIIRLLYHQNLYDVSLTGEIIITGRELQEKYEHLNINGEERIKRNDLEDTLRILRKHNIINYKGQDFNNDDFRIVVYSTIKYVIDLDNLEEIQEKLKSYEGGLDLDEEITED